MTSTFLEPQPNPIGADGLVPDLIRRQAVLTPDATAVRIGDTGRLTYAELQRKADRLAVRLAESGVGLDDRVAVLMGRSAEVVVAMLAVMQAGGAYAPIDPDQPAARVAAVINDLDPQAVIADPGRYPVAAAPIAVVDPFVGEDVPAAAEGHRPVLHAESTAYVLYTSGTTGTPKGVAMSHAGLRRLIEWQIASGEAARRTLQFTSLWFDVTFQEVFSTLATGGTLFVAPDELRRDADRLLRALDEWEIECLFLPYVALQQLAKAAASAGRAPRSLRHVITAGEQLVVTESVAELFARMPGCRLDNHYGPTEAHLVTSFTLAGPPGDWPSRPPIGTPVAEVELHLLDKNLEPVAPGTTGELYVGGPGVARGYLNAPAQTAERFLPDPFALSAGGRMYRTGDLAHSDADGVVHFEGRSDNQLKVRGFRVEAGEVESALLAHTGVRAAAVGVRQLGPDIDGLVAYLVAEEGAIGATALADHLKDRLPGYMIPDRWVWLDRLPLTATGKLDRRVLSEVPLPVTTPESGDSALEGDGSLQGIVREIWVRVLGHDEMEPDDDFFDIGGDSLLAAWVVAELAQRVGRRIDLTIFLQDSTIEGIAAAVARGAAVDRATFSGSEAVTLRPGPLSRMLVLAPPLGGELLGYRELASTLQPPLRVVGLRWEEPDGATARSLQSIAEAHVAQLRSVQSEGPYRLAGWSFGGVVAYEMAQQLQRAGERVDFLGLLDANPRRDPLTARLTAETDHVGLLEQVLSALERSDGEAAADTGKLIAQLASSGLLGPIPEGVTSSHVRSYLVAARNCLRAAMAYQAEPYGGDVHLFQAGDTPAAGQQVLQDELRGLVLGALHVTVVPGDHFAILRAPHVDALARAIDVAL